MRTTATAAIIFALSFFAHAAETSKTTVDEIRRKGLLMRAVTPDYPIEARRNSWTGRGIFELRFDYESGRVDSVRIVHSTGHAILDAHAIAALKLWQVKPHSMHGLRLPITFTHD
jgi:TonB family protein